MKRFSIGFVGCVALSLYAAGVAAAPIQVALDQVPGQVTQVGLGAQGSAAGSEFKFSGFDASQFTEMYFGVKPSSPPTATFQGNATALTFDEIQGTTAIWIGNATVDFGNGNVAVPLRFLIEVTGLGADPWIDPTTAHLPAAMGAAVADPQGLDFDVKAHFQADYGSGFGPLTPASFLAGGSVGSSVGSAFFVVRPVPEPSTLAMALGGLVLSGVAVLRRKRPRQAR